jgi:hypothetical protein
VEPNKSAEVACQGTRLTPGSLTRIGFPDRAETTGLAWPVDARVGTALARTLWTGRVLILPSGGSFDLVRLDVTLVPAAENVLVRAGNAAIYRGVAVSKHLAQETRPSSAATLLTAEPQ